MGADVGEEEEVGAGAQVVVVLDGLAGLGQEEGGGAPVEPRALDEAAGVEPEEGEGRVAALVVDLGLARLAVAHDLEVKVEGFLLAEGEAEAEVAHGVGVEDDARHEGGCEDHAEDDGDEQPPVGEAPLSDDPQEGGEAVHGASVKRTGAGRVMNPCAPLLARSRAIHSLAGRRHTLPRRASRP